MLKQRCLTRAVQLHIIINNYSVGTHAWVDMIRYIHAIDQAY